MTDNEAQSLRSNGWRRLHFLTSAVLSVSIACWIGALSGLLVIHVKLWFEDGDAFLSDPFGDIIETAGLGNFFIGAILTLLAGAALCVLLVSLQVRHAGARATLGLKQVGSWLVAGVSVGLLFYRYPDYGTTVSDARSEYALFAGKVLLQVVAAATLLGLIDQYRSTGLGRVAVRRPAWVPVLGLAAVSSITTVGLLSIQLRGVAVIEEDWSLGEDSDGMAFDSDEVEHWSSEIAASEQMQCLAAAGLDEDDIRLVDERFEPWFDDDPLPSSQVKQLAAVVKDCVGVEAYTGDLVYLQSYIAAGAYDSEAFADCLTAVFAGPEWDNYWVAASQSDSDENNRIVGLCRNVASSGLGDFVATTTANLPAGLVVEPIEGYENGLQTPDGESRVAVAAGWLDPDSIMTFGGSLSDEVVSINDEGFALVAAAVDAVLPDLSSSEREVLLTALVERNNGAVMAGVRVCLVHEVQIFVVNSTMPCSKVPGASN